MRYPVCLLLLLALGSVPGTCPRLLSQPPPGDGLTRDEKKFLELTNEERAKQKLPPLKLNATLSKVARAHSENMAKQGKMAHVLDDKNQYMRIKEAGYRYSYAGENVARGKYKVTGEIMQTLMKSKGHRENILREEFVEVGIGIASGADGIIYYTQVFGTPKKRR
jgi:uncharacterized protein YkwD